MGALNLAFHYQSPGTDYADGPDRFPCSAAESKWGQMTRERLIGEEEWAEIENKCLDRIVTAVAGVVLVVGVGIVVANGLAVAGGEVGADAGSDSVQGGAGLAAEPGPAGPAAVAAVAVAVDADIVAKIVAVAVAAAAAAAVEG